MATKIEWVQNVDGTQGKTWNPITGCTKISPGCQNCYAERMAQRLRGRHGYPYDEPFKVTIHPNRLDQPTKWRKPLMIFVCSMGDIFHDDISNDVIFQVLRIIKKCPHHTFQILTKRSARMLEISENIKTWPSNVWVGVTVEAPDYKNRINDLKEVEASVRFLSCEPLLANLGELDLERIDWVIVGGESGARYRPIQAEWVINIRDQCVPENIPYFFKQWAGIHPKKLGSVLEGKEWKQMPTIKKPSNLF